MTDINEAIEKLEAEKKTLTLTAESFRQDAIDLRQEADEADTRARRASDEADQVGEIIDAAAAALKAGDEERAAGIIEHGDPEFDCRPKSAKIAERLFAEWLETNRATPWAEWSFGKVEQEMDS